MEKITYFYLGFIAIFLTIISSPIPSETGFSVWIGELVGFYFILLACSWIVNKFKRNKAKTE